MGSILSIDRWELRIILNLRSFSAKLTFSATSAHRDKDRNWDRTNRDDVKNHNDRALGHSEREKIATKKEFQLRAGSVCIFTLLNNQSTDSAPAASRERETIDSPKKWQLILSFTGNQCLYTGLKTIKGSYH